MASFRLFLVGLKTRSSRLWVEMGVFEAQYDLQVLQGAAYNPRKIGPERLAELRQSLKQLGIVKPIIARGQTIIAGHQRARSALVVGMTHGPVYLLDAEANVYDEVRFNQLHNGTDMDCPEPVRVEADLAGHLGWVRVPASTVKGNFRSPGAVVRVEIQQLVAKFGAWGACVVAPDGEIVHASHYALAVAAMGLPVLCYILREDQVACARHFLGQQYGVFSYEHLERNTFVQTYAQPFRLRGESTKRSLTYDRGVLPWLETNPGATCLDFGSGQGDHAREARQKGHDVLDVGASRNMVLELAHRLREHGPFDGVVCDYVLNSVDSSEAEASVLACLDLFVKPGGRVFFSGRSKLMVEAALSATQTGWSRARRRVQFLDERGFSAFYRQGQWFYQRFHDEEEIAQISDRHGWEVIRSRYNSLYWIVHAVKKHQKLTRTDYERAVRFEFTLPVNSAGRTLEVVDDMLDAVSSLEVWESSR
jgi:ParB family chromosome partitioning protein